MRLVQIEKLVIGSGRPKICVPIVAKTFNQALEQANKIKDMKADIVEVRIDHFDEYTDEITLTKVLTEISAITSKPLLFTFRTRREGGEKDIDRKAYCKLIRSANSIKAVDLIDLEYFTGDEEIRKLIKEAHLRNKYIVLSNHDFSQTPDSKELYYRLMKMENLGADIAKIAVMPISKSDVLRLMDVSQRASQIMNIPIITMSMGPMGLVTRINGEFTCSAVTFGSGENASAPGQIPCGDLAEILQIIHKHTNN